MLDTFLPPARRQVTGWLAALGLVGALGLLVPLGGDRGTFCLPGRRLALPSCSYVADHFTLVFQVLVLGGAAVVVLLSLDTVRRGGIPPGEFWFLLLSSAAGALTLPASRDLPPSSSPWRSPRCPRSPSSALRRDDGRASEAALKFFLVSVTVDRRHALRAQLRLRPTGPLHLDRIAAALDAPGPRTPLLAQAVVLTLVGFAFKIAAVPFHFWVPDTYVGAPLPIAAYLSVVCKAVGFSGLILLLTRGFPPYADVWGPVLAVLAALTMTVGNVAALRQTAARYGCSPGRPWRRPATCWCRSAPRPSATTRRCCRPPSPTP